MMFKTHLIFGILAGLFFARAFIIEYSYLFVAVVAFFAIFPDIDMYKSKIGSKVKPISFILNFLFGHRGFVHSLLFAFGIYGLFYFFVNSTYAAASFIGFSSHLLLDGLSPDGIKPLFPFRPRINGIIRSNGIVDYALFFTFLAGIVWMLI
ncbi:metal-dependent hydrolase [Candidatus Woesearchaeota archaeon]|nr:metal-dependent hydrolase [Candidatus Woesearchaeota archaeon]